MTKREVSCSNCLWSGVAHLHDLREPCPQCGEVGELVPVFLPDGDDEEDEDAYWPANRGGYQ